MTTCPSGHITHFVSSLRCCLDSYFTIDFFVVVLCCCFLVNLIFSGGISVYKKPTPLTHCGLVTPYSNIDHRSTLAQVMAYCLMTPSNYLNQCWLVISKVQWDLSKGNFTRDTSAINHWNWPENNLSKISFKYPRGQWVKLLKEHKCRDSLQGVLRESQPHYIDHKFLLTESHFSNMWSSITSKKLLKHSLVRLSLLWSQVTNEYSTKKVSNALTLR